MKRRRPKFLEFDIDLTDSMLLKAIDTYADRFVREQHDHYDIDDYCEQVSLDLQLPTARRLVKERIRQMESAAI